MSTHLIRRLGMIIILAIMLPVVLLPAAQAQTMDPNAVFTDIYNQVSPSVVSINVAQQAPRPGEIVANFVSSGSGFVIDQQGHIVTNSHVVQGAGYIEVSFVDGLLAEARIVGTDPDSDLAVIQVLDVPSDVLVPSTFGDSDALEVGQTVLAIGSPFGERWTLTSGIISGLDRTITGLADFTIGGVIQTDAAINPGNSGGPLLNLNGEVIGVNSQIVSATRSSAGIGFAVPANLTQRVASMLIDRGFVQYSYLGIRGGNVTLQLIQQLDLPRDLQGVMVTEATPGGPAARAGLQSIQITGGANGVAPQIQSVDIITAIDGTEVGSMEALVSYLARNTEPGQTVTLTVLRNGETMQFDTTLSPRP